MLLHDIYMADIENGDTLLSPKHVNPDGTLKTFDRVIANPPFSQNYTTNGMEHKERFHILMPESGKKGDFMFVQHMISVLKDNGKMAVIMPHGVLFRGGKEKEMREWLLNNGLLEAIIGLPEGLFYGTSIPACILVINKDGITTRKSVLFINADREYFTRANQNTLRPEDIEKISHVYHKRIELNKYSRIVILDEIKQQDYNLSIRRYVDNSPDREPQDINAHLNGGIPLSELKTLSGYFANYPGTKEILFEAYKPKYLKFSQIISNVDSIKSVIETAASVVSIHNEYKVKLKNWWEINLQAIRHIDSQRAIYDLYRKLQKTLIETLMPLNILNEFQIRGALANFWFNDMVLNDLKSVAANGFSYKLNSPDTERLTLVRWEKCLIQAFEVHLIQYREDFITKIKNLYTKYAVTIRQLETRYDNDKKILNQFLSELGYVD
jgi:type I restriction enzyme M protein